MISTTSSGAPSSQAMSAGMAVLLGFRRPKVPKGTLRSRWSPPAAAAK